MSVTGVEGELGERDWYVALLVLTFVEVYKSICGLLLTPTLQLSAP